MAATSMNRLRLIKQTLLLESELNRLALAEDMGRIQRTVPWPIRGSGGDGSVPWLRLLTMAGSFAAGNTTGRRPWLRRFALAFQIAAAIYPILKKLGSPEPGPKPVETTPPNQPAG